MERVVAALGLICGLNLVNLRPELVEGLSA